MLLKRFESRCPMKIDNIFPAEEDLYLRLNPIYFNKEFANNERLTLAEVRFPDFSVNRGKYSKPENVLKPIWFRYGIASFKVKDIPDPLKDVDTEDVFSFKVEHAPEKENRAHSEIRTYKNGLRKPGDKLEPSKTLRTKFREQLRKKIKLIKIPQ